MQLWTVLGWNDLGMHCMDSDYSLFAILPPFNLPACRTFSASCVVWRNGWMQGAARSRWLFHWQESQRCRRRCDAQPEGPDGLLA